MRLGELLISKGLLDEQELSRALDLQRERSGDKLGKILIDLGFVAPREILAALSEQLGIPVVTIEALSHRCSNTGSDP